MMCRKDKTGWTNPEPVKFTAGHRSHEPHIPMDNSEAERRMRPGAVGRKNYYGSGAIWSAYFAASLFSIFQTLLLWNINPRKWLSGYLLACAENGGQAPQDISGYLPWNMPEEKKKSISLNHLYHDTS